MSSSEDQGSYEMLWDCPACGTEKLLGVTHRFCPACGTPQDPEGRYFPSDDQRVAVADHKLVGRDRTCAACDTPNANEANNCMGCGSPLDGAKEVDLRGDVVTADGVAFEGQSGADAKAAKREKRDHASAVAQGQAGPVKEAADAKSSRRKWVAGGGTAAAGAAALMLWSSAVELEVSGHSWERAIEIESFGAVQDGAWCSNTPSDARNVSSHRKVKSHKKVADGETCTNRRVDNGNGSFSQRRECTPKFRKEPVYDQWCDYTVDRWHREREETASGSALDPAPEWPAAKLAKTGDCIGCEREGARSESYTVHFLDHEKADHDCKYTEVRWRSYPLASKWAGEVGVMGGLDCDEVAAPGEN